MKWELTLRMEQLIRIFSCAMVHTSHIMHDIVDQLKFKCDACSCFLCWRFEVGRSKLVSEVKKLPGKSAP